MAQDTDEEDVPPQTGTSEVEEGNEIVVTGIRASLASSAQIKRNAEQIVDSITAQDIGALPDRSVSEALQRIPGITLQRTNEARDPARLAAEGGGVFIRGLSWVRSELNGRDVFSANNGRAITFEDISADLMAGIDVYKNPSAELIEGSIGGLINLRTRKPLDQGRLIAASADYNYADLREKGFWSGNALISNRWDTGGGEFGLLLSGSIGNIGNRTDSMQTGAYTPRDVGGETFYVPNTLGFRRIDWQQRRVTLDGVVQYRPTPELTITGEAIYTRATPKDIERNVGDYASPLPDSDPSYVFDDRNVLQSGSVGGRHLDNNTRYGARESTVQDYSLNFRFEPSDHWTFTADVQRVVATSDVDSFTVFVQNASSAGTSFDVDFDLGDDPLLHYTPQPGELGPANYWWAAAMDHFENNEADQWAYKADAEYDFLDDGFLRSFRAGVRATDRNALNRQTGWNWSILSCQHWGSAGGPCVMLDQDPGGNGLPSQAAPYSFDNFFRGGVPAMGSFMFPTEELVSNGTENAFNYLQSTLTGGWGWMPLADDAYDPNGGVNNQSEKTLAGYGMLRFGSDEGALGRFDGNIGVRVVRTSTDSELTGIRLNAPQTAVTVQQCQANAAAQSQPASICDPLAAAYNFFGGTFAGGVSQDVTFDPSNEYTDILPTLNVRFFLQDDLQLRLAAGKAIVRPNFGQLNPFTSLSFNFDANGFPNAAIGAFTGNGASPNLKPIRATQFDASLEYYFDQGSMLTVAAFYKRIKDYIFASQETRSFTANGETIDFELTTLSNGDKGSIKGFEVGYQQFFDFLPGALSGLGLQANYTFVDSSGGRNTAINVLDPNQIAGSDDLTLPLEGLSKHSYNVALMYEMFGISARLAYNWREKYLLTTSAANINRPVWFDDYGQLDGSILYSVTPQVKIGVQGTNLLAATSSLLVGGSELHPRYSWTRSDRRIAFLVRTQF